MILNGSITIHISVSNLIDIFLPQLDVLCFILPQELGFLFFLFVSFSFLSMKSLLYPGKKLDREMQMCQFTCKVCEVLLGFEWEADKTMMISSSYQTKACDYFKYLFLTSLCQIWAPSINTDVTDALKSMLCPCWKRIGIWDSLDTSRQVSGTPRDVSYSIHYSMLPRHFRNKAEHCGG